MPISVGANLSQNFGVVPGVTVPQVASEPVRQADNTSAPMDTLDRMLMGAMLTRADIGTAAIIAGKTTFTLWALPAGGVIGGLDFGFGGMDSGQLMTLFTTTFLCSLVGPSMVRRMILSL